MSNDTCSKCGEFIDKGACNQTYSVTTVIDDADSYGTKKRRYYLCEIHAQELESFLKYPDFYKIEKTKDW